MRKIIATIAAAKKLIVFNLVVFFDKFMQLFQQLFPVVGVKPAIIQHKLLLFLWQFIDCRFVEHNSFVLFAQLILLPFVGGRVLEPFGGKSCAGIKTL